MAPLTLHEAATVSGRHVWWELRLFELAGRWATVCRSADVTVALAVQANVHAARAEQWHRRLPALAGWDPDELTAAPHAGLAAAVARLGQEVTGAADQLVALHHVLLPARLAAYRAHLARSSAVCDAPAIRVLEAAVDALPGEIAEGERLLGLLSEAGAVDRAPAAERRCRELLRLPRPDC